jgi:hypothetical protein
VRPFLLISSLCATVALIAVSAALAGQPVTQTLTPPPPPYETCKAVGNGTICQGTITDNYGPYDTGITCGSGPGAFDIFDSGVDYGLARRMYEENGNLVGRQLHDRVTSAQFSNPLTGATVPYTQSQARSDSFAVPGDFGSATETITGEIIFRPAGGAPVLIGAGRVVFAPDGTTDFSAGPTGFLDLLSGNTAALRPLCTALGAA